MELLVLHRDDQLLVVAKPSGMLVHNGWARETDVALQRARQIAGQHVFPVHRLDRGTSGVLVFALSSEAARTMQVALHESTTVKSYVALVRGITPEAGVVDHPLAKSKDAERRAAVTRYERLGTFERYSLVAATPETGRLHQIRRHMKHISHPLIGDVRYGKREHNHLLRDRFGLSRLALHAFRLQFRHPTSGEILKLEAALPADLRLPLEAMGLSAALHALATREGTPSAGEGNSSPHGPGPG